jgi:glycosyltransferase involved in cell wall biosynthesis
VARIHGVPESRLRVVFPGPDPSFRPLPLGSPEIAAARRSIGLGSEPFYLFVGKRSGRRNLPAILEAFTRHRRTHPSHRLVFVGPEGGATLPDAEPAASAGIMISGHVAEPVLRGLLADAVALLYPSNYEGFGLPVVEAMASGCPVVTLRNGALSEAGGDAPWYLDKPDADALAHAMHMLAVDPAGRALRVERGLAYVARFSRARFAREIKEELQAAASEGGSSSTSSPRYG